MPDPWTRFSAALPPDTGEPFEVRLDDEPDVRFFVAWCMRTGYLRDGEDFSAAYWRRAERTDIPLGPRFGIGRIGPGVISPDTRGWWRLLPADDPPAAPGDGP